jgi:hypothetical protein
MGWNAGRKEVAHVVKKLYEENLPGGMQPEL